MSKGYRDHEEGICDPDECIFCEEEMLEEEEFEEQYEDEIEEELNEDQDNLS